MLLSRIDLVNRAELILCPLRLHEKISKQRKMQGYVKRMVRMFEYALWVGIE